jgi:hypothetical protein
MTDATKASDSLDELDLELRRHITRLLEIAAEDLRVSDLIYTAVEQASRIGQECTRLKRERGTKA